MLSHIDLLSSIVTQRTISTRVRFPTAASAYVMEAKSKNSRVIGISAHGKDPQVVKINPEPSTLARLIACVSAAR